MAKFELKVNITATTREGLADALALIQRQVAEGYREGHDRNETSNYYYAIDDMGED